MFQVIGYCTDRERMREVRNTPIVASTYGGDSIRRYINGSVYFRVHAFLPMAVTKGTA